MLKSAGLAAASGHLGVRGEQASLSIGPVVRTAADDAPQFSQVIDSLLILSCDALGDALAGMEHSGVVTPAERLADPMQRDVGEFADEMDGDLARPSHTRRASGRGQLEHV